MSDELPHGAVVVVLTADAEVIPGPAADDVCAEPAPEDEESDR